ncbi:MAG: GH1 family beta-glucosidase [Planctomycetota bacterium]
MCSDAKETADWYCIHGTNLYRGLTAWAYARRMAEKTNAPSFPDGFLWGVASAAYQVEGAANRDGRTPSVWDTFSHTPGKVYEGHTGDIACGSYDRPDEDAELIAKLGAAAYRLSISWPRVLPNGTGTANVEGLDYYNRLIDALLARGVEPWVTVFHWDLPQVLHDKGGWLHADSPGWFEQYTELLAERLGDRVKHWFTFNEPQIFVGHGYARGIHAPGLELPQRELLEISHNVLLAHGRAVQAIRSASPEKCQIGWAPVGATAYPTSNDGATVEASRRWMFRTPEDRASWFAHNTWYSDPVILGKYPEDGLEMFEADMPEIGADDMATICQPLDFFGVNIYSAQPIELGPDGRGRPSKRVRGYPVNTFGWAVEPDSLYWGPKFLSERYGLPVYITENGLSSMDWVHADGKVHDTGRIDYLCRHLHALRKAVREGVDVRGYFQWSIMDNFEWAEGYHKRFGLAYVDYETLERIPKDSYHWYREVIASNGRSIPAELTKLR